MIRHGLMALFMAGALGGGAAAQGLHVAPAADEGAALRTLETHVSGRAVHDAAGWHRQWPATYFTTAFTGPAALFRIGPGEAGYRVSVDGGPAVPLVKPAPGLYRVDGLAPGLHRLRIDVASESQAGPSVFGGFFAGPGTAPAALADPRRQIEFIGDSHTVGYANSSAKHDCTQDEVWATTDGTRGLAPLTAARFGADYRVNAISGRGVVRNYNGFPADTMIEAYPYALLDHTTPADDRGWNPQVIVLALGTNDFTTALHAGERWASRDQLHADYERTYVGFLDRLRKRHPKAFMILWSTDMADGEIAAEEGRVVARMQAAGDRRIAFLPMHALSLAACHSHPNLADDQTIATALAARIDAEPGIWGDR